MKMIDRVRDLRWSDLFKEFVCLTLAWGLASSSTVSIVHADGSCHQLISVRSQQSDCSCSATGPIVTSCGSGIDVRQYEYCEGGFDSGYEMCLNSRQEIGSRWNCVAAVTWSKIADCSARAAVCAVACASSATHAGVLCAACTGCGYVSCVKRNVKTIYGAKKSAAAGVCPSSVNTGR